jgi:hypothetical protein
MITQTPSGVPLLMIPISLSQLEVIQEALGTYASSLEERGNQAWKQAASTQRFLEPFADQARKLK